jgi:outer membrane protein assembly factor BamB
VWSVPLEGAIEGELASDGERIFVALKDGRVRAFDAATGAPLWEVPGRPGRIAATPGSLVLGQADGILWGIDPTSGSALWKTSTGIGTSPGPVLAQDLVILAGQGVAAVDGASGKLLWTVQDGAEASALPARDGDRIVVGEKDGTLRCRSATNGSTLWVRPTGGPVLANPVFDDRGRVLVGTTARAFLVLKVRDDGKQAWRWRLGADVQTPAAHLGERVFVTSFESVLYAFKSGSGAVAWRASLPSRPRSGPLLVGQAVIVACHETELLGYDVRNGKRLGTIKLPAGFATSPLVLGRRFYVGLRDRGSIVALEPAPPPSPSPSPGPPSPSPAPASTDPSEASPAPSPSPTPSPTPTPSASPSPSPVS